ncbi:MAG: HNH endonuclease [Lachnospiraceae bacterium]|nr:HNH endonuclease [Lachnospiraceae bacterium]
MDLIKLYEADRMEVGKKIEARGIKEREKFLSRYPIESIPNLTIEQYLLGDDSFSHWLHYGLSHIADIKGVAYPHTFGVYTTKKSSQILLSSSYKEFWPDYEKAFIYLKKEIVNFLEDIRQKNYNDLKKYKINSIIKNMLMIVYFYDRFVPVCTNPAIDKCLKSVSISIAKKASMVDKNLALVEWKNDVPKLAGWSNQMVLDFCFWLERKNITTNKEEICNNAVIETAQKIEEEIISIKVNGTSKKAIVNARVNQGIFRDLLLKRYDKCCLCNVENQALLIASHIKPWAESEPKEKLDVNNGFLMCPNHDRLFDNGYITFNDDGKIIISDRLTENDRLLLNVNNRMHIDLTENNKKYLKFHRENVFDREIKNFIC